MDEYKLKTVATFSSPAQARLAQGRLQEAGITAFLQGEETGHTLWHVGTALGGVAVQVPNFEVGRALELIGSRERAAAVEPWACEACGSEVDAGFEVCWSCGALMPEQPQPPPAPEGTDTGEERSEADAPNVESTSSGEADELLARAWKASIIGIAFLQGVLHVYSALLLVQYHRRRSHPGANPNPRATAAFWINFVMILVTISFVVRLLFA